MTYDAIVVGGSFAGLAAATYLARARRSVCVIDAGRPRNRFADASHGFLGHDGDAPQQMLAHARRQLSAYPTVSAISGEAFDARIDGAGFSVTESSGAALTAHKLILALGLRDTLPAWRIIPTASAGDLLGLAHYLAAKVRINSVLIGTVLTPGYADVGLDEKVQEALAHPKNLTGRAGKPQDVANAFLWLASPAGSLV